MISIVEETYLKAQELSLEKIGLIGTKFTMGNDFFKKPFISHNIEIVVPNQSDRSTFIEKLWKN